jgi:hypothetical protein
MAVYIVTGTLGSGKSLVAMGKARDYLWNGRRVATNVNIQVENLVSGKQPHNIFRVPDHPTAAFLWDTLGYGGETRNENSFGMFLMDEVGTWLNAREWNGKDRQRVIEWFIHSRKRRWDCYLLTQSLEMIDRQVRLAIAEHVVVCGRADRLSIPFIGFILEQAGIALRLPQVHIAKVFYTAGRSMATATKVATWIYRGRDLWGSYDTSQRFQTENDGCATMLDPHGYGWLRKPKSFTLDLINVCKQRGWQRLERMLEIFHTMTPEERGYRLLQLWEAHGNAMTKPLRMSFDEWAETCEADQADAAAAKLLDCPSVPSLFDLAMQRAEQAAGQVTHALLPNCLVQPSMMVRPY